MSDFRIFGAPQSIDLALLGLGVWDRLAHFFFRIGSLRVAGLAGQIRPKNIADHVQAS
jgi:hypothetical protein